MTNSNDKPLRQMDKEETDRLAVGVLSNHSVRLVARSHGCHGFVCDCGALFPLSWGQARQHLSDRIGDAAEAMGAVPHATWGGMRITLREVSEDNAAPLFDPVTTTTVARGLIADLVALLKADGYPVRVGVETLKRADAFLCAGDEAEIVPEVRDSDVPVFDPFALTRSSVKAALARIVERDQIDGPAATVALSMAEIRLIRSLAETHAEVRDGDADGNTADDIVVSMRLATERVAMVEARNALRDAHHEASGSYNPEADRDSPYSEPLQLLNEALGWNEPTP